jgi:hypothetical protein
MKIPNRYEDLTVNQFQQLELIKERSLEPIDEACSKLSILSGKSIDYIESMKPSEVYDLLLECLFLTNPLEKMECPETFTLGFKKFRYIKAIHEYTTAQQKDFTEILKQNGNNYIKCLPELMAICHQELTLFGWQYKSENHFKNVELFKESKLKESLGAVFFYSNCLKHYNETIEGYFQMIVNHKETMMKDLEFQTFLKGGDGNIA